MSIYRYPSSQFAVPSEPGQNADYRAKLLSCVDSLPPLPMILNKLLQLMNDSYSSSSQISAIIEKDGVLSGNVLRCVNSAYYGLQSRVSSIRHAVTLLGFDTLRNLALAFSMRRMLQRPKSVSGQLYSQYSQHALGAAIMTEFLAHFTRSEDIDAAFAAGLFHDVGKLVMINSFPDLIPKLTAEWENRECTFEQVEEEMLGLTHSELSQTVVEKWKLPEVIQQAVRYHHQPSTCLREEESFTLADLVHAADAYVNFHGLQIHPSRKKSPPGPEHAFERIGLRENLPELHERFETEFQSIRGAFQ